MTYYGEKSHDDWWAFVKIADSRWQNTAPFEVQVKQIQKELVGKGAFGKCLYVPFKPQSTTDFKPTSIYHCKVDEGKDGVNPYHVHIRAICELREELDEVKKKRGNWPVHSEHISEPESSNAEEENIENIVGVHAVQAQKEKRDVKKLKMGMVQNSKGTVNVQKPFLQPRIPKESPLQESQQPSNINVIKECHQDLNVNEECNENLNINEELKRLRSQLQQMQEESRRHQEEARRLKEEARKAQEKLRQKEQGEDNIKNVIASELFKINQTLEQTLSQKLEHKFEEMRTSLISEIQANQTDSSCEYIISKMGYAVDWVNAISMEYCGGEDA